MPMKTLKILENADREFRLEILQRDDGYFQYRSSEYREYNGEAHWLPTGSSGVYARVEDAERDALNERLNPN